MMIDSMYLEISSPGKAEVRDRGEPNERGIYPNGVSVIDAKVTQLSLTLSLEEAEDSFSIMMGTYHIETPDGKGYHVNLTALLKRDDAEHLRDYLNCLLLVM